MRQQESVYVYICQVKQRHSIFITVVVIDNQLRAMALQRTASNFLGVTRHSDNKNLGGLCVNLLISMTVD